MRKKAVITLLFVLPILVNCQTLEHTEKPNLGIESMSFDEKTQPDIRGIISYDKYQVVVANGNETVLDIAKRLDLDPRKFSLFNGLVESYRPRQGELLALNKKIDPIKNTNKTVWSQNNTKNVLERAEKTKQVSVPTKGFAKHTVETGETIYSIARLYNVSVTSLASNLAQKDCICSSESVEFPQSEDCCCFESSIFNNSLHRSFSPCRSV